MLQSTVLISTKQQALRELLNTCSKWANKWKLQFSPTKSKTLTTRDRINITMKLQGNTITEVKEKFYKYLGLPITKTGIDVDRYYKNIKQKIHAAKREMIHYCTQNQINFTNKTNLYKTVVRAQIDYGIPVINYNDKEIKELEEIQQETIKRLLKMHPKGHRTTLLAMNQLPTIENRINTAKLNFYLKLKQPKQNSLSHLVYRELKKTLLIRAKHIKRLPPITEIDNIIYYNRWTVIDRKIAKGQYKQVLPTIKKLTTTKQNQDTIYKHGYQHKTRRTAIEAFMCPLDTQKQQAKAIAEALEK